MTVAVTGAAGFIGRHLTSALVREGHEVRGLSRRITPDSSEALPDEGGGVAWVHADLRHAPPERLTPFLRDADAVVHLVGIITERPAFGETYGAVHVDATRRLMEAVVACERSDQRVIFVSACGAAHDAPTRYARSKAAAEAIVRAARPGAATILRPSLVLGPGAGFLERLRRLVRRPPVVPVPRTGTARLQPVAVADLAQCVIRSLSAEGAHGKTIDVGGADTVALPELVEAVMHHEGIRRPTVAIPLPLLYAGAATLEALWPSPPVTADQVVSLSRDNVCDTDGMRAVLGVKPAGWREALEAAYGGSEPGAGEV